MKLLFLLALAAAASYTSLAAPCASCHAQQSHSGNAMNRALEPVAESRILLSHPRLSFEKDGYAYRLQRAGGETVYTVTGPTGEFQVKLKWALGQGAAGQTYVYEQGGNLYESRVSFFDALNGLDLTMGAQNTKPRTLAEAAGRLMSPRESAECIGCHATNAVSAGTLHPEHLIPGVQCARCHENAAEHALTPKPGVITRLTTSSTEEMSNFCGQCHRTWEQIAADGPHNINNVRFQPYRLANSKCYDTADPRIKCTACHNPHDALSQAASSYDAKCQACHQAPAKVCKTGQRECTTCHMPKFDLPGAHHTFTDHWIRIVKNNAPYPN